MIQYFGMVLYETPESRTKKKGMSEDSYLTLCLQPRIVVFLYHKTFAFQIVGLLPRFKF